MATNEDAANATAPPQSDPKEANEVPLRHTTTASPLFALKAMGSAARRLFGNWRALTVLLVLYAALLASLYFFIAVREARLWQVMATFLLAALAVALFFIIQAIGVRYVEPGATTKVLLRWSVRDFWKLLVIIIPLLLLAWLVAYLFGKFQVSVPAAVSEAGRAGVEAGAARSPARSAAEAFSWKEVVLTTLRSLILYLVLPLIAIHLWIAVARQALTETFRNIKHVLARALSPGSVLVYAIGFVLFGMIPYLLITTNFFWGSTAWREISLLGGRLLLASLFILIGWLVTLGALSIANGNGEG